MTAVFETNGLGKKYGRRWALPDCTLAIFLGAALILAGACIWWIRRRLR